MTIQDREYKILELNFESVLVLSKTYVSVWEQATTCNN
jgi:hypothetical protein